MSTPLSDLWLRANANLDRAEQDLRMAAHPDIVRGLEKEVLEQKGICSAISWIIDHEDMVANVMAAERKKLKAVQ